MGFYCLGAKEEEKKTTELNKTEIRLLRHVQ